MDLTVARQPNWRKTHQGIVVGNKKKKLLSAKEKKPCCRQQVKLTKKMAKKILHTIHKG